MAGIERKIKPNDSETSFEDIDRTERRKKRKKGFQRPSSSIVKEEPTEDKTGPSDSRTRQISRTDTLSAAANAFVVQSARLSATPMERFKRRVKDTNVLNVLSRSAAYAQDKPLPPKIKKIADCAASIIQDCENFIENKETGLDEPTNPDFIKRPDKNRQPEQRLSLVERHYTACTKYVTESAATFSAAVNAIAERGARFSITPALDELMRSVKDTNVFRVLSRSASYERPTTPIINHRLTRSAPILQDYEPLIGNDDIEGSSGYLGSNEHSNLDFASRQNSDENLPLQPVQRLSLLESYITCSKYVAYSLFIVFPLILLLGLSCFSCYMGIKYVHECKLLENHPMIFVFMGATGIVGTFSRIVFILTKKRWFARFEICRFATLIAIGTFLICYIVESLFYIFNEVYPSTEKGPGYCDPLFYNYVYWYNWAALGILFILAAVHVPYSCRTVG